MLRLAGDGCAVRLGLTGYQFPALVGGDATSGRDWDANWVLVHGEVVVAGRSWVFDDPCLTTWEAAHLADWLDALASSATGDRDRIPDLEFTEPQLGFRTGAHRDAGIEVVVALSHDALPPDEPTAPLELRVSSSPEEWRRIAAQWRAEVSRFPPR